MARAPRTKWALVAITVVLMGAAAGALSRLSRSAARQTTPGPAIGHAAPSGEVSLQGKIAARHLTSVAPQISGQIEAFLADVGQEVSEGQLLARLSNSELDTAREAAAAAGQNAQARVNKIEGDIIAARLEASRADAGLTRARGELERAQRAFERQKLLHAAGATPRLTYEKSQQDFQLSENDYNSAEVLARQAGERVAELTHEFESASKILDDKGRQLEQAQGGVLEGEVHSPVSGLVVARHGEVGGMEEPGTELFRIATDSSALQVDLEPEPAVLARLRPGQAALVFVAEVPEGISGQVSEVKDGRAGVAFFSPSSVVKPGMTAQVRLLLK